VTGSQPSGPILVVDLSASLYIALLGPDQGLLASRVREQGVRGEAAHDLLGECLSEAGATHNDIASICVGAGPGSFTGIRVAVSMSQGLAFAKRLPMYPFSSLAAQAASLAGSTVLSAAGPAADAPTVVAAIAANGGRYFVLNGDVGGDIGGGAGNIGVESLITGDELEALGSPGKVLITSGKVPDQERLDRAFGATRRMEEHVDFTRIARLALSHPPVLDGVIRPNYLMGSAAEEKRKSQGLSGAS
jgi:tRNA threonylcarbamoyl adenosine modification protein YeaZ